MRFVNAAHAKRSYDYEMMATLSRRLSHDSIASVNSTASDREPKDVATALFLANFAQSQPVSEQVGAGGVAGAVSAAGLASSAARRHRSGQPGASARGGQSSADRGSRAQAGAQKRSAVDAGFSEKGGADAQLSRRERKNNREKQASARRACACLRERSWR